MNTSYAFFSQYEYIHNKMTAENNIDNILDMLKTSVYQNKLATTCDGKSSYSLFIILFIIFLIVLTGVIILVYIATKDPPITKINDSDIKRITNELTKSLKNRSCTNEEFVDIIKVAVASDNVCQNEEVRWQTMVKNAVKETKQACELNTTTTENGQYADKYQGDRPSFGLSETTPGIKSVNVLVDNNDYVVIDKSIIDKSTNRTEQLLEKADTTKTELDKEVKMKLTKWDVFKNIYETTPDDSS